MGGGQWIVGSGRVERDLKKCCSRNYRDLIVWQKSMDLAEIIYSTSKSFPMNERDGLFSQIRRAVVSIPST